MAEKISVEVDLKSHLSTAKSDLSKLKTAGAFDSKGGQKVLTKLEGFIDRLEKVDLKDLDGPELTKFLNNLTKLRDLLDSSARGLTAYSKEFQEQSNKVVEARKKLREKRDIKSEKLQAKKDALTKVDLKNYTYWNTKTGKKIEDIDKIAELYNSSQLEIRGKTGKKPLNQDAYNNALINTGIKNYADATKEHRTALEDIKTQEVIVKAEELKLSGMQQPTGIHPLTKEVSENSASTSGFISKIKDQSDEKEEEEIHKTTEAINKQIPLIEKQTSSLGRAFKQFTIYNIAVRAAKTALREAVQTVQELDKYLTEQAMVTGLTRKQTYELVGAYQELALQCGATTKEIAGVATEYMKQGKTIQESLTLTQAAVSAAKVARVSVGDSVNYLTTALNGFQLSAEDAMRVSDKFAAVAASSATDYDELAIALSKVASQANLAGMSIDYTTALLTKGLETTREAPETMGTALKTIIARMRELSDYGETLEGDTDINNVESQLAYVGIALRDTNGELRSTEDVLDELGKKWDTLNKNQQAALAKALAGTRQQSRLIALMDDYERVTELQEISQRSAGATAAQAGVYLEGMEASMNKIQVAWEKIVMNFTDSDVIIGVLDRTGNLLDAIGNAMETAAGSVMVYSLIASIGAGILINKIAQHEVQKVTNREILEEQKTKIKIQKLQKEELLNGKKRALQIIQQLRSQAKINELLARATKLDTDKSNDVAAIEELSRLAGEELALTEQEAALKAEIKVIEAEIGTLSLQEAQTSMQIAQNGTLFASAIGNALTVLTPIMSIMSLILMIQQATNNATLKGILLKKKENKEETVGLGVKVSGMVAKIVEAFSSGGGIPGVIAGIAIATALAAALGVTIAASLGAFSGKTKAEKAAKEINVLSNEIYKLNEKVQAINKITDSFDALDNKLIKTNADLKEMSSLLDQAADKLDTEVDKKHDWYNGKSEKEYYESFSSDEGRQKALQLIEKNNRNLINQKRKEQIQNIRKLKPSELKRFLSEDATSAEVIQAQDAIYATNNSVLYEHIDLLKETTDLREEESAAVEKLSQSILDGMTAEEAWNYAKDESGQKVRNLVNALNTLDYMIEKTNGEFEKVNASEILTSDDYSLKQQIEAYGQIHDKLLEQFGATSTEMKAFNESFKQYEYFTKLEQGTLDFIDSIGMSIDDLNTFYDSWEKLQKKGVQISKEEFQDNFDTYLEVLANTQGDILMATKTVFGDYLDDSEDALNAFISAYGDLVQVGILNMGQNLDKVKNSINSFYEKSLKWNEMSESDKAQFIQDNAELFGDNLTTEENEGKMLLDAFESGNYNRIENTLRNNEALNKQLEQRRKEIEQELLIENARTGADRNEAYIAQLEEYQEYLSDVNNLFKASLEVRLEQEKKHLDEYRSLIEERQKAEEDSLNKRKEAYEKYFESINEEQEDADYEEQADMLINNLSKLGSSTNASAVKQSKELEKQLEELEKERLKELRERAQEAVLENMDDQLEQINEKFDKLLENNRALLAAMQGELENPAELFTELIQNQVEGGLTATELQSYIGDLQSTYGNVLNGSDLEDLQIREENNQLYLTVNGQDIVLDTNNEQNLYNAIIKALREVGLR